MWSAVRTLLAAIIVLTVPVSTALADEPDGVPLDQAKFEPGQEVKIKDPLTGGAGYWVVYVPSDYVPTRKWPVIFTYHGLGLAPTTGPFRNATDGKGYVVVGMEYEDAVVREPQTKRNVDNLSRIRTLISKSLPVDERLLFLGGFSQGGFRSTDYGEARMDTWAGLIVLLAGRGVDAEARKDVPNFKGKPIFIGDGDKDEYFPLAEQARDYYTRHGATVTFEPFRGMGHAVDENDPTFRDWLKEHGPLVEVRDGLAAATAAEGSGKLGSAYAAYQAVAEMADAGPEHDRATSAAQAIATKAQRVLDEAEADLAGQKFADGTRVLMANVKAYSGCEWGEKIDARLKELRTDPAIQSQIAQAKSDAAADLMERQAAMAEREADYKRAIALLQSYVTSYARSHRIAEVRVHLAKLRADKKVQSLIATEQRDADCKGWLGMARNYTDSERPDLAKRYFQKVIDTYPDTPYAQTARKELAAMQ